MKQFKLLLIIALFLFFDSLQAQTSKLSGVYAGCQFSVSPLIGGGMNRKDVVILFRTDGTFNDQMGQPDWSTKVTGKYNINGNTVTLNYAKGNTSYTIKNATTLHGYGFQLFKLQGSSIPPGYFEFTSAMGSGGGSSGLTYVGSSSHRGLNFDNKGHFSNSRNSAVLIAGENVGGGSTRSNSGNGTYKINDGVLTLNYSDGKIETHSFFCDLAGKTRMAAVDGRVYFSSDDKDEGKTTKTELSNQPAIKQQPEANPTDGMSLLLRANNTQGGSKLDVVKTAKVTATAMDIKVVELIDAVNNKVRIELWKNGRLSSVQQTEGSNGWLWANGNKTLLPKDKVTEAQSVLYTGMLGLRKQVLDKMQVVNTQKMKNTGMYTIECTLDGNNYIFAVDDQNRLTAYGYKIAGKISFSLLSDWRPVQGLVIPFHEVSTSGSQKLTIQYDNFEINPDLDTRAWAIPAGN
ncbi:hypothetical protein ACFFGT_30775 [Mucilaginibacter angelicae]|uniref:Uncharacterized protein n=1 Tax=Mucilaginibacter angelicae TaxID=869718 RepID=A0ABV6LGN1_9SPHI